MHGLAQRGLAMAVVVAAGASLAGTVLANGRAPAASSLAFRPGSTTEVLAGMTFGTLQSTDGGMTWYWMCEAAVGYGGIYDPDYAIGASGVVFATTFDGLRVDRDGCSYDATALGSAFVAQVEVSGTLGVHASLSDPTTTNIVASNDDGVTFPTTASPGQTGDWWQSLRIAPSDTQRLYLAGYRIDNGTRSFLLFTSDNGGTTFSAMTASNMQLSPSSVVSIVGVSPATPTTVYAMVTFENGLNIDGMYVSTNAGTSWTRMLGGFGTLAFLARANGQLVITGPAFAKVSSDGGLSWTDLPSTTPHLSCLAERADGVVWGCTQPFVTGYAIMTSSDLMSWTPRLRFQDITGPVTCPIGTAQHDTCLPRWCFLREQLGIFADPTGCEPPSDGGVDGIADAAVVPADAANTSGARRTTGCCSSGGARESLLLLLVIAGGVLRRRSR